ncbi:Ima1 N-terminal domain-containing protein [Lenzites betulinus]|nr:Ima1 N-terminal domain-containing protein [Lenzites betulinus]
MPKVFRHPSSVSCFYCQSTVTPTPRNPRSFQCPECDCWNRYDENGEIMSDEPAMHDENLNARSFAKRASPRKDRFLSTYGNTVFCHTCQTNQMLIANFMSNYLPPPDDPQYEGRLEAITEYRRSVETRYPPICPNCLPAVEEEIRKRDHMARVRALGGALKTTRGTDSRRRSKSTQQERDKLERELRRWKFRGCLWVGSLVSAIAGHLSIAAAYHLVSFPGILVPVLPALSVASIFWTVWDPTYATFRKSQFQGRAVRIHGKQTYISLQLAIWFLRLSTAAAIAVARYKPDYDIVRLWHDPGSDRARVFSSAMLFLEIIFLVWSHLVLKVQHPPPVKLIDSKSHLRGLSATPSLPSSRSTTPAMPEHDLLATLSLSSNPVLAAPAHNPIFGLPSLATAGASSSSPPRKRGAAPAQSPSLDMDMDEDEDDDRDPDAMDIDPSSPVKRRGADDDASWLRPQRFFAPEEPTGLENLFATTIRLVDSSDQNASANGGAHPAQRARGAAGQRAARRLLRMWPVLLALCIVPLFAAAAYRFWDVRRRVAVDVPQASVYD